MGDLVPVFVAAVVAIAGGLGTWWTSQQLRRMGFGGTQTKVNQLLREESDLWEGKFNVSQTDLAAERTAHAATRADLDFERRQGQQCRADLDDARSDIRVLERQARQ